MGDRYNLLFDKNAVSELVGYLILVSVAVTVIGITYAMTMPQITDSQNQATFQSVEQAFTVLDTHMSKSQYSNDLSQLTEMKLNGGKLAVDDNEGTITINFKNYAHNPVYTGKLGTIIYTLNGREVGYEGGGIWERYSDGGSAMISAPDFNYNGETLTLPLMQIKDGDTNSKSSESTTGSVYITSKSEPTPEPIYPNDKYLGETTRQINPVKADEVTVIIKSRYYQAWANYINSNTDGHATINPATQEVTVTFYTRLPGEKRPFRQHEPIEIRGLNYNNHDPLSAFYLDLNGAKSKMQVDLKAPADNSPIPGTNPALRISFKKEGGLGLMGTTVTVEYTENGKVETFEADVQALINPDETAHIDLLNTGATTEYTSNSDSWTWVSDGKTYTKHDDPTTYPDLETVLQHYIRLMGEKYHGSYSLYKSDDGGQHWPADSSTYTLDYDADNVLTYMHITNNPITVTLG